jgi:hypothetical protein
MLRPLSDTSANMELCAVATTTLELTVQPVYAAHELYSGRDTNVMVEQRSPQWLAPPLLVSTVVTRLTSPEVVIAYGRSGKAR